MNADMLDAARAAIERDRGIEARMTPGEWASGIYRGNGVEVVAAGYVEARAYGDTTYAGRNAAGIARARNRWPLYLALSEAVARLVAYQANDTGDAESPWWAWGHCLGCGAEAGPPNNMGYNHADDCPALAIDAALAALAEQEPTP